MNKARIGVDDLSLRPSPNSILAAAVTAHALDVARRKAAKANPQREVAVMRSAPPPLRSNAERVHESLPAFLRRVAQLVAAQIREREKKRRS